MEAWKATRLAKAIYEYEEIGYYDLHNDFETKEEALDCFFNLAVKNELDFNYFRNALMYEDTTVEGRALLQEILSYEERKRWMRVTIDGYMSIPAYLNPNDTWNGFVRPYFKAEDVPMINEMLAQIDGDHLEYDKNDDSFVCYLDDEPVEAYYGVDADGMHLYPIGAGSWVWMTDEEE